MFHVAAEQPLFITRHRPHDAESAGFIGHHVAGIDLFLDGPDAKPRPDRRNLASSSTCRPWSAASAAY